MKQSQSLTKFRVYCQDDIALIVTGVGKLRSAMGLVYAMENSTATIGASTCALNIGVCGSCRADIHQLGEAFVINRILDHGSQKEHFPDMLLQHSLTEDALETFDRPVSDKRLPRAPLVDLEAAGFYAAASVYLNAHRIACVKIVSDFLEGRPLRDSSIGSLIKQKLNAVTDFIEMFTSFNPEAQFSVKTPDSRVLESLATTLRLTVAQRRLLQNAVEAYLIRTKNGLDLLRPYLETKIQSRRESKQHFHEIMTMLTRC